MARQNQSEPVSEPELQEISAIVEIPFLKAVPVKPAIQVVFDLGVYGTQSTRYHAVVENEECLVLIYDTRYEGNQYVPPKLNADTKLTLFIPQTKGKPRKIMVLSLGLQFSLGCLDCVVLIPDEVEPPSVIQPTNEDE